MTPEKFTVAAIQQRYSNDPEENLEKSIKLIRQAAAQDAKLIVLTELHRTPYFCQTEDPAVFDLAESIPGPTSQKLAEVARDLNVVIVASLFERRAAGLYHNTAIVLDQDGSLAGCYRKMHIPDDPGYYEKFYFTPGDLGFEPIETSLGKLGVLVCWDQWYPEAARLMTLAGADLLIYPTAIGWNPDDSDDEKERQLNAWITVQRGHAVANGLPVIACNRYGTEYSPDGENSIDFWGNSFIAGPQGEFITRADSESDAILMHEIDLAHSENVRRIWPFLRDRRIDAYHGITERYLAGNKNPAKA